MIATTMSSASVGSSGVVAKTTCGLTAELGAIITAELGSVIKFGHAKVIIGTVGTGVVGFSAVAPLISGSIGLAGAPVIGGVIGFAGTPVIGGGIGLAGTPVGHLG